MDSQRLILFLVFAFSVFFLVDGYYRDRQVAQAPAVKGAAQTPAASGTSAIPATTPSLTEQRVLPDAKPQPPAQGGEVVKVETDELIAEIDALGGELKRLELRRYRDAVDPKKDLVLLDKTRDRLYVAQSGLIGKDLPNHRTLYTVQPGERSTGPGRDTVAVRLTAATPDGVQVAKTYRFRKDSYVIDVAYEVTNKSSAAIDADAYFQLVRDGKPAPGDSTMVPTFTGYAVYTDQERFQKVEFSDVEKGKAKYTQKASDGWVGLVQHYFVSAWLPAGNLLREYYVRRLDNDLYAGGVILPVGRIEPGQSAVLQVPLYAGPQEQDKLHALAPGLELTVDYGWLTVIAAPLFWLLRWIHQWVNNWGVAIIILTIIIKGIFYPLSAASYRSMAKMRVVAPRLQRLKEQYGDDRQRLHQAMMEIYRKEKINPLGGCLPIVVQIPVFIALYWVLLASVELRGAPFYLWIHDLSKPDPFYVLPVLMGATMILQTRMSPEPPDPVQAKVMKIMPIAFSVFFFFFPAGLVIYWLVNNVLSIAQQWSINRSMDQQAKPRHGK
jgi:YidC/Oxa1 family membrane protein insertase